MEAWKAFPSPRPSGRMSVAMTDAGRGRSPVNPPVVSVDVVEAATERISADLAAARKTRLGARSSRQRRLRVAASRAPAHEAAVAVVESSRDEAWPSIEWLRP